MPGKSHVLSHPELLALLADDAQLRERLLAGERLEAQTPFSYPGRLGPVRAYLALAPEPKPKPAAPLPESIGSAFKKTSPPGADSPDPPPPLLIRISDGGGLIKSLAEQGMELEVDMVLSKTVFHAVAQHEGAGIAGGQVYVDSPAEAVGAGLWRFLQLVGEIIGLRHAKYKDALVQLERRRDAETDALGWRPT